VVGVGADLPVTVTDATAIGDLLRELARCAYPPDQVKLLTGDHARREHVVSALGWLAQAAAPMPRPPYHLTRRRARWCLCRPGADSENVDISPP